MATEHTVRLGIDSRPAETGGRRTAGALDEVRRAANRASSSVDRLKKEFEGLRRIGEGLRRFGTAMTIGITLPVVAAAAAIVKAAADMDRLRRALVSVAGSTAEADTQLRRLKEVAKVPGLGFREAIQGSVRLQAVGLTARQAEAALTAFGNAIAAAGGGKAQLDRVSIALTQIVAKGQVMAEEIRQMQESVPQVRKAMEAAFGTASTEQIQAQGISAREFISGITAELGKLEPVTGGAANAMENFGDSVLRAAAAAGNKLLPVVVPMIEGLSELLEESEALDPSTVRLGIAIGTVAAVLGPLTFGLGAVTTAVSTLAIALGTGLLPILIVGGPLLIGLGALATFIVKNKLEAAAFTAELDRLSNAAEEAASSLENLGKTRVLGTLRGIITTLTELQAEREALLAAGRAEASAQDVALGRRLPGGLGAPIAEADALNQLTDEQRARFEELQRQVASTQGSMQGLASIFIALAKAEEEAANGADAVVGALDPTVEDFGQVVEAIQGTRDQIDDLRFELSSVFERDETAATELRDELERLERQLVRLEDARDRLHRQRRLAEQERGPIIDIVDPQELIRPDIRAIVTEDREPPDLSRGAAGVGRGGPGHPAFVR